MAAHRAALRTTLNAPVACVARWRSRIQLVAGGPTCRRARMRRRRDWQLVGGLPGELGGDGHRGGCRGGRRRARAADAGFRRGDPHLAARTLEGPWVGQARVDVVDEVSATTAATATVVQSRLGHASAEETLNTYSHLWPDSEDRTRAAIDAVLGVHASAQLEATQSSP
jgi:hypothetical protein